MSRSLVLALVCACLLGGGVSAQTAYPSKPVRIIVPSPPGGGTDTIARAIADPLSKAFGRQFIVENRPGAAQMIGIEAVARSAPDGHTLLMSASTLTINHLFHKSVPYDAVRDFAPISLVVVLPSVLVVDPNLPVRSLAELIALAKQKPGALTYGSAGIGSNPHVSMELLKSMAGIDLLHIPFKGVAPAMTDILGGRLSGMILNVLIAKPQVEAGKLRALAATGLRRAEVFPSVPTVAEAGVPGYEALQWFGLLAPAGTPAPIVERLHAEVVQALRQPEVKGRLANDGAEAVGSSPAEFAAFIKDEIKKWGEVARVANIKPE